MKHLYATFIASQALVFAGCMIALVFAGCMTHRELDPTGVYQGDRILFEADKAILAANDVFDDIAAFAERNPQFIASEPKFAAFVADLETKRNDWLIDAYVARDAYEIGRDGLAQKTLEQRIAFLNTILAQARVYLATQAVTEQ